MYAGTNGGGVYKSTDYGATWETVSRSTENPKQGQNLIYPYIKGHSAIAVDPDNHNAIYVGTGYLGKGNVYRSLDGGMNWNSNNVEEWNGLYNTTAAVLSVLCDGSSSSTDYPYVWIGPKAWAALCNGRKDLSSRRGAMPPPPWGPERETGPCPSPLRLILQRVRIGRLLMW